jgi:hypothetical protein
VSSNRDRVVRQHLRGRRPSSVGLERAAAQPVTKTDKLRMEPLWSPVVATGGNQRQIDGAQKGRKQAKSVAAGCHRLPETFHGKEGVDGSNPSEGSANCLHI